MATSWADLVTRVERVRARLPLVRDAYVLRAAREQRGAFVDMVGRFHASCHASFSVRTRPALAKVFLSDAKQLRWVELRNLRSFENPARRLRASELRASADVRVVLQDGSICEGRIVCMRFAFPHEADALRQQRVPAFLPATLCAYPLYEQQLADELHHVLRLWLGAGGD